MASPINGNYSLIFLRKGELPILKCSLSMLKIAHHELFSSDPLDNNASVFNMLDPLVWDFHSYLHTNNASSTNLSPYKLMGIT
jgi:hypothetical protein